MVKSVTQSPAKDLEQGLRDFLHLLRESSVLYFPIRHHSPACSWHLQQLIKTKKPKAILIEGPDSFNGLLPLLTKPEAIYPLAIYSTFLDKKKKIIKERDPKDLIPPFFSAYYPFCDYSPELVAVKEGTKLGARVRFIDLPYHQQLLTDKANQDTNDFWQTASLLAESHLNRSEYVHFLAKKLGCRNHDDLWDHLFESNFKQQATEKFISDLAAYCYMSRLEYNDEVLGFDGTLAREKKMAWEIQQELANLKGKDEPIIVVTGGFHTANLPQLVQTQLQEPTIATFSEEDGQTVLIPYSFDQLDALNGYASGMPSPYYYDLAWTLIKESHPTPFSSTVSELIVSLGRMTREKKLPFSLSPADEIVAFNQARRLASLRGHNEPTREDFLDAVRSCFVKGAMDAEGMVLMSLVKEILSGNKIGTAPPGAAVPPIISDFRAIIAKLNLDTGTSERKEITLNLYRKARHRKISRFFQQLLYLEVPLGRLLSGPDFIHGLDLNKINEIWEYAWSPQCESQLVRASIYGVTVEDSAVRKLMNSVNELEKEGKGRSSDEAVGFLLLALQMGLHKHAQKILNAIKTKISEDNNFKSLIDALNQLILIYKSREPLETHELLELPQVIEAMYQKACFLIQDIPFCPEEDTYGVINGFCVLSELLAGDLDETLDAALFLDNLEIALKNGKGHSSVIAGAAGILYREGRLSKDELIILFAGYVGSASSDNRIKTGFVYGLLQTCRELTWNHSWLLDSLDKLLQEWDENDFVGSLPELRLAFAGLTPNETDKVAGAVAQMHGQEDLGDLVLSDVTESEMTANLQLNAVVAESLKSDNLEEWLP